MEASRRCKAGHFEGRCRGLAMGIVTKLQSGIKMTRFAQDPPQPSRGPVTGTVAKSLKALGPKI